MERENEGERYREYSVKKGDTLWDISGAELKDPFLWPKVWKENDSIENPDLIYPGMNIRIPLFLLQKEIVPPAPRAQVRPEIRKEAPVEKTKEPEKKDLIHRDILIASGSIVDPLSSVGKITESRSGKTMLSKRDFAYIDTNKSVKKGDKFYIIHSSGKVTHPKTGKKVGYLIEVRGIAEVIKSEARETEVEITNSFAEIEIGDLLQDYYEFDVPVEQEKPDKPQLEGYIVEARQFRTINGNWDIVYLDKGRDEGIKPGDLLATTAQRKAHLITNGVVQIIATGEKTSTAVVRKTEYEIGRGDGITGIKEE